MKDRISTFVKRQWVFLLLSLLLLIALGTALILNTKADLHVALNEHTHTPAGDWFFKYYTLIAEIAPYVAIVALLFYRFKWAMLTALGQIGAGLTTQIIKRCVNMPRPSVYFATNYPDLVEKLHYVAGVHLHSWHSFPSGHTTAFFSLFFCLSMLTDRRWLQALCFFLAALGGYSRIYLSQHFSSDVFAGILVGVTLTAVIALFPEIWDFSWGDKRLPLRRKAA